jgi:hypothetical protein
MKAYVATTGIIFALIVVAHILRAIEEGPHIAKSPPFILLTLLAVALCIWAVWLFQRLQRSGS